MILPNAFAAVAGDAAARLIEMGLELEFVNMPDKPGFAQLTAW